jgi:rod shape determining protein RodA
MSALAGSSLPRPTGPSRFLRNLDVLLLLSTVALVAFGLVMVYSSTHVSPRPFLYVRSQALHLAVGLVVAGLILAFDYRALASSARPLYVVNLLLLGAVLVIGGRASGRSAGSRSVRSGSFSRPRSPSSWW